MARKPQQSKRKRTLKKYTKGLKYYKNLSDRQSTDTGESTCNLQNVSGSACPKCGCQIYSPFGDGRLMHDVNSCGGIVPRKEGDIIILP